MHHMSQENFFVVGIGASAGGLRALEEFFENMPADSGAAFIVVQHLSPDFKSLMKELLERRTRMEVHRVEDGMTIAPNKVYLIPPGKNLVVKTGKLHLSEQQSRKLHGAISFPINIFFHSLADCYAERAVGIVLSGTGSDGTQGLQSVKEAGGTVLVQTPQTAEFDGMPQSAIATGIVDRVLPPVELAELLYEFLVSPLDRDELGRTYSLLVDRSKLQQITDILTEHELLDFSCYKKTTVSRRINRRCLILRCADIDTYIQLLRNSPEEREILASELLINVTRFFRDTTAWAFLESMAIAPFIEQTKGKEELRFWVTACSTGEEAYSLAILIDEVMQKLGKRPKIKIFATDVDRTALEKATVGCYPETVANDLSEERLEKYFVSRDGEYQVKRHIREMLIFAPHDLTKDAGFTRMHLVTCRNVLIYLEPELQQQVLRNLHFSLNAEGMLFLGEAENLGDLEEEFIPIEKRWKLYRKRRDIRLPLSVKSLSSIHRNKMVFPPGRTSAKSRYEPMLEETLKTIVGDRQSVCLIVDREHQLLNVYGDSTGILTVPQGKLTKEVVNMVVQPLKLPLNTALHRARKEDQPVLYTGIVLENTESEARHRQVNLKVIYHESNKLAGDFLIVTIENDLKSLIADTGEPFEPASEVSQRIVQLEFELNQTRENLRAVIEELETTNEEQQATNEELIASNEELQSTNEELHSVNEELHTVNTEYQSKIQQLVELNNDIDNLLQSTDIGVVFLDRELRIRKFTSAATQAIYLVDSDVGRPLANLAHNMDIENLTELLTETLTSEQSIEKEVTLRNSNLGMLMRINPYRGENEILEGVVLSFVDISDIVNVQEQLQQAYRNLQREIQAKHKIELSLRESEERWRNFIETISDWVWETDENGVYTYVSPKVRELLGYEPQEILGKTPFDLMSPVEASRVKARFSQIAQNEEAFDCVVNVYQHRDGREVIIETSGVPILDSEGNWKGYRGVDRDVSQREYQQNQIKKNLSLLQTIVDATPDLVFVKDREGRYQLANQALAEVFGKTIPEIIGKRDRDLFPAETAAKIEADDLHFLESKTIATYEETISIGDRDINYLTTKTVYYDSQGKPLGTVGIARDINDFKEAQAVLRRANLELEQRVKARTSELATAKEAAEAANRAKSIFIANMSHELRTPLNSILGFAQILQQAQLDGDRQVQVATIYQSGKHLLTLINDILHLAKIEVGKLELQEAEFNFPVFIEQLLSIIRINAERRNLYLRYEPMSDLPAVVKGDETRLRQVLFNLLGNAIKFTATGGVTLKIGYVGDFSEQEPNNPQAIRFAIEDTGIGIDAQKTKEIFLPFQQVKHSHREGTGLGLTISQNIVKEMGGQIQVTSEENRGSNFWFDLVLPVVELDSIPGKEIESVTLPVGFEGENQTILVIDNNPNNLAVLTSLLTSLEFSLLTAATAQEAINLSQKHQPDAVIFDYSLPSLDAAEMLKQIAKVSRKSIKIIGTSALNVPEAERLGDAFLPKPINLQKLLRLLANYLHIQWIYPERLASNSSQERDLAQDINSVTLPPQEELASLLEQIKQGNIAQLKQQANQLRTQQPQCAEFSAYAIRLADSFQLKKLRQFIQSAMD